MSRIIHTLTPEAALRAWLAENPCPSTGRHVWKARAVAKAVSAGAGPEHEQMVVDLVEDAADRKDRGETLRWWFKTLANPQIDAAPEPVRATPASGPGPSVARRPPRSLPVSFDPAVLAQATRAPVRTWMDWFIMLQDKSPVDPANVTPSQFLDCLFPPGTWIAVVTGTQNVTARYQTRPPNEAPNTLKRFVRGHEHGVWWMVQPITGEFMRHPQTGFRTCRSECNVVAWPHLVLESDEAPAADWLAFICSRPFPLRAVYTSGGRSIHALLRMGFASADAFRAYSKKRKAALTMAGADPGCLSAVRLSRLPGCWRENKGAVQRLLYLDADPHPVTAPLLSRPSRVSNLNPF